MKLFRLIFPLTPKIKNKTLKKEMKTMHYYLPWVLPESRSVIKMFISLHSKKVNVSGYSKFLRIYDIISSELSTISKCIPL